MTNLSYTIHAVAPSEKEGAVTMLVLPAGQEFPKFLFEDVQFVSSGDGVEVAYQLSVQAHADDHRTDAELHQQGSDLFSDIFNNTFPEHKMERKTPSLRAE